MTRHDEQVAIRETVGAYRKRKGTATRNDTGRVTVRAFDRCSNRQLGRGYLLSIRGKRAKTNATPSQVTAFLKSCDDTDTIVEIYPTRFCVNPRCGKSSWQFKKFPLAGHATCMACGFAQKLVEHNMDSRHLGENEKVNKSMWNCTPGCDVHDTMLTNRKGGRIQIGGQRIRSHQRHFWGILADIDNIAEAWQFPAMEMISRRAKQKCKRVYYTIHDGTVHDNHRKMPHGQAQFAAACLYAAILEFERQRRGKTPCTLTAIQESASKCVFRKRERKTRDVTVAIILRYTKMLQRWNLCSAAIPDITADTLRFASNHTGKEHTRLAIFNRCQRNTILLPADEPWGLEVGDTEHGVLYVENVSGQSAAFQAGLLKGDYIFQVEDDTIGVEYTPASFASYIGQLKQQNKSHVKVTVMREKK